MLLIYVGILIAFALFLYFQTKVKNHGNYPITVALFLLFFVFVADESVWRWIVDTLNHYLSLDLPMPKPLSLMEKIIFAIAVVILIFIFYGKTFSIITAIFLVAFIMGEKEKNIHIDQKNTFFALFNTGDVHQVSQNTIETKALLAKQEEMSAKINLLLQQYTQSSDDETKRQLERQIKSLQMELIALKVNDKALHEAQNIMRSNDPNKIERALRIIQKENSSLHLQKRKDENKKQAKLLLYEAMLHELDNNYTEAKQSYEEAINFHANFENLFSFAFFLQEKMPYLRKAGKYYRIALEKAKDDSEKAMVLNNLAVFYAKDTTTRQKAKEAYEEALKIRRELAKQNPQVYLPYVATTLNNLANFYAKDTTTRQKAKEAYEEALKIYQELAKQNPQVYNIYYANTLLLGVLKLDVDKKNLKKIKMLLEPYPDTYRNVWLLRDLADRL